MAPQVNYGPPQNSGRKVIDNTDASAGKPISLSAGKVPIPRELFTSQHPAVPNTPNNEKTPRSTPAPATPHTWYDAGNGLPADWLVRDDKMYYQSPKGSKHRSLKSAFRSVLAGDKLVEGGLTLPEVDFINKVLQVQTDAHRVAIFCCPLCTAGGRDRANMRQHVSQQHPNWKNMLEFTKPLPQMNSIKRKAEVQSDSTKKIKFSRQVEEMPEDDNLLPGNSGSSSSRTCNSQPRKTKMVTRPDLPRGYDISEDSDSEDDISEDESTDSKRRVLPSQTIKEKRIKIEALDDDVVFLADEKHESSAEIVDKRAKQRVIKTLVTGSEQMRSQEPLDEKLYSSMIDDVERLSRFVRDKKFMQTMQNVSYGKLASYKVKGFFSLLAAAILDKS